MLMTTALAMILCLTTLAATVVVFRKWQRTNNHFLIVAAVLFLFSAVTFALSFWQPALGTLVFGYVTYLLARNRVK